MFSNSCGESCGWLAAALSALAFGTFGVPIKSEAAQSVDIDPLVFQSYKTFMCFATSWLVLVGGEEFTFSPWGIVSGLFWVPGGVATVYAVKSAGLAIGIGIGSSFIVLVSFIWGVFIFHEHVHSRFSACFAILSMMLGLFGMSYYSSPEAAADSSQSLVVPAEPQIIQSATTYGGVYQGLAGCSDEEEDSLPTTADNNYGLDDGFMKQPHLTERTTTSTAVLSTSGSSCASDGPDHLLDDVSCDQQEETFASTSVPGANVPISPSSVAQSQLSNAFVMVNVCGYSIRKRTLGMLSAAFCGLYGGSILAPMKFCRSNTKGTHYLMSFSIGASIVTVSLWLCRYLLQVSRQRSFSKAYHALPSFHFRVMWLAGGVSGLLWSIGNFFSLLSVFYLGEGVGYPLVQTSILISGLWGIFYFNEVQGQDRITKWFISSLLTVFGILLLSYEHHEK